MLKPVYAVPDNPVHMISETNLQAAPTATEEAEIEAAKKDPARFSVLYNRYYEPVFRYIYQRVDSKDLAADLCAQTFLKAMLHLKTYRHMGLPFVCWLYRIAGNELRQEFRKNSRHRTINTDHSGLREMIDEMEESSLDEYHDAMLQTLPQLPEDDVQLIEMRYFEKRPFKEIGEILDITENNAKVKLYRALDRFKKKLTETKTR